MGDTIKERKECGGGGGPGGDSQSGPFLSLPNTPRMPIIGPYLTRDRGHKRRDKKPSEGRRKMLPPIICLLSRDWHFWSCSSL